MTSKAQQADNELRQRIIGMAPHAMLPREVDLAAELNVSRSTLRQALGSLSQAGLIYAIPGTGTFVADHRVTKGSELSGFSEDMRARGMEPASRVLRSEPFALTGTVAADLGLEDGALAYRVERLRLADCVPMCVESVVVPADTFPRLLTHDLAGGLYELFDRQYGVRIVTAHQSVSALRASKETSDLLEIDADEPVLSVFRIGFDGRGRAVERTTSQYRADRYEFVLFASRR